MKNYILSINVDQKIKGFSVHFDTDRVGGQSYYVPTEEVKITEPCEDAISRQEAKHALCKAVHKHDAEIPCDNQTCSCLWTGTSVQNYAREIDALPSVTPKPRTGRWFINSDGYYPYCSECKAEPKSGEMTDYCPNCGAKMCGGEQE